MAVFYFLLRALTLDSRNSRAGFVFKQRESKALCRTAHLPLLNTVPPEMSHLNSATVEFTLHFKTALHHLLHATLLKKRSNFFFNLLFG